jgi:signal transduction histidine kinase
MILAHSHFRLLAVEIAGILAAIILCTAHRLRLRAHTDRIRNLIAERLSERERAARDVQDTLLQGLQGLILLFQGVAAEIPPEHPLACKMEAAIERAERFVEEGRESIRDLHVPTCDLADSLRSLNGEQRPGETGYSVEVTGQERELQFLVLDEVFKIAREAVVNAFHHASANHVWVTLAYHRASLDLRIVDDGRGIWTDTTQEGQSDNLGIATMRDRALKLKSTLQILNRVPAGTEVRLTVPARVAYRTQLLFDAGWLDAIRHFLRKEG